MPIKHDPTPFRPPDHRLPRDRPRRTGSLMAAAVVLVALLLAGFWLWRHGAEMPPPPPAEVAAPPQVVGTVQPAAPAPDSGPAHPVEPAPALAGDLRAAVAKVLGSDPFAALVETGDFPRRFVATVDSLGREHTAPLLWPVPPTPGRFAVTPLPPEGAALIGPENAARYRPFIMAAEHMDPALAAQLYRSIYPQLQQAYRTLGFGDRYFNDRLIEVIDLLLAAPEPSPPVRLQLLKIQGPDADPRPWTHWEFADPQLQSLPAGQKIMVRMGLENERRLKKVLQRLRKALIWGGAAGPKR